MTIMPSIKIRHLLPCTSLTFSLLKNLEKTEETKAGGKNKGFVWSSNLRSLSVSQSLSKVECTPES